MIYVSKPFPFPHYDLVSGRIEVDLTHHFRPLQRHIWTRADGIEDVESDAWILGYHRQNGEYYTAPQLTASEYLEQPGNPFPACSAIRRDSYLRAGGFPDVAFQDYGLWRRMAHVGMTFQASTRAHYRYSLHSGARSNVELLDDRRAAHMAEMRESEVTLV